MVRRLVGSNSHDARRTAILLHLTGGPVSSSHYLFWGSSLNYLLYSGTGQIIALQPASKSFNNSTDIQLVSTNVNI